jgi:hypothetical protein
LGLLLGLVGPAPAEMEYRYTFGQPYLVDGISLVLVALGMFGIVEVASLLGRGGAVSERVDLGLGWRQGLRDVIEHRWLVVRGSLIGIWAGVLPAVGATAGTIMTYGHVVATSKDRSRFGKGDIRGIIAPEAANNAVEAGDLIPTLLFGVPGSAPAAMIMGTLLRYGVLPGPRIVNEHLDLIYVIVWTFAAANIIGAAIMFASSPLLARLARVRFDRLAPAMVLTIMLAAFQETRQYGDLLTLVALGAIGYAMKATGWPRAPLLIGFVLAGPMERYFWLTVNLYQKPFDWLLRPGVLVLGALLVAPLLWGAVRTARRGHRPRMEAPAGTPLGWSSSSTAIMLLVFGYAWWAARDFLEAAALMPIAVAIPGVLLCALQLVQEIRGRAVAGGDEEEPGAGQATTRPSERRKPWLFLAAFAGYVALFWLLGFRYASALWVLGFVGLIARMGWAKALLYTVLVVVSLELLAGVLGLYLPPAQVWRLFPR